MATTVTSKGQVTIPKRVRDLLGIEPGGLVDFERGADGRVVLVKIGRKARPIVSNAGSVTIFAKCTTHARRAASRNPSARARHASSHRQASGSAPPRRRAPPRRAPDHAATLLPAAELE